MWWMGGNWDGDGNLDGCKQNMARAGGGSSLSLTLKTRYQHHRYPRAVSLLTLKDALRSSCKLGRLEHTILDLSATKETLEKILYP